MKRFVVFIAFVVLVAADELMADDDFDDDDMEYLEDDFADNLYVLTLFKIVIRLFHFFVR